MKKPKLLYLSCHSIAEFDEVKLLQEIGFDVFSHGAYTDPGNPGDKKRPGLPGEADQELIDLALKNPKEKMSKDFISRFDIIYSHWMPSWIAQNWENMLGKIVILRTNGQSTQENEEWMAPYREAGLHIVRYAPIEQTIPGYCGHDAIIRFYKDPDEFSNWNGKKKRVITVVQNMKRRAAFCNYDIFNAATLGFDRKLYGPDNELSGKLWGGCLEYSKLKQAYRDNRVYFYTGTKPACYTLNFIEAWMTGIPIVAIGGETGNPGFLPNQYTYEIPFIMKHGVEGFVSDDIGELHNYVETLLNDPKLAKKIGAAGRKKAIELFGKETIKKQWIEFFKNL